MRIISLRKIQISIFLGILFACIGCDQATKYTAKHFLEGRNTLYLAGDFLRLGYVENTGAFLSLGAGLPETIRWTAFVLMTAVFLTGIFLFVLFSRRLNPMALYSSALILGGGLGNLIDRILRNGAVIDFMNVGIKSLRTGVFNVADVGILVGVGGFILATHLRRGFKPSSRV